MKIPLRSVVILFFLSFPLNTAYAEEPMTWQDCVHEAGKNHPDLFSSAEKLKQAKADKAITRSAILPQINSEMSRNRTGIATKNEITGATTSTTNDTYSYGISGKQLLFDGFKTFHDIGAASATMRAFQYDYAVSSSNVRLNLRTAFSGLLRAQELVSITEEIALRRKQNVQLVKLRYEAGREHRGSLLTAEADLAQAELEVTQAKRNVKLAQRQLTKELGRERLTPVMVTGTFETMEMARKRPDFEQLADITPFLNELVARKEAAQFGFKSATADFFPEIYVNGSLGRSASYWPPDGERWSAGVTLSFPILEGGSRIAKVSKAKAQLNQAQADERSGRDSVLFTLEGAWTEFQNAIDKISVQRKYLQAAEERAKIANAQYSTGLISFDNWIIIEDSLVSSKKAFLDSKANMLVAEANWIQAKGGILEYAD
ncbi:MAG: TolC family protein [Desulfobacterales bacterium]|nr:TolC family protein [Desulfobacterales bacterium]